MPVELTCDHCSKAFRVRPSRAAIKRFCSQACHIAHGNKHGHSSRVRGGHTATYRSWAAMIQRCTNPNSKRWDRYGGRGITVCERWLTFENFLADMGERPAGLSIDRVNNDGNYEPKNCRWATRAQQSRNQAATKLNETAVAEIRHRVADGETRAALARCFGVDASTVSRIVSGEDWRAEEAA